MGKTFYEPDLERIGKSSGGLIEEISDFSVARRSGLQRLAPPQGSKLLLSMERYF